MRNGRTRQQGNGVLHLRTARSRPGKINSQNQRENNPVVTHQVSAEVARERRELLEQRVRQKLVDFVVRNVRNDEVLLDRHPKLAAAVLLRNARELDHVVSLWMGVNKGLADDRG